MTRINTIDVKHLVDQHCLAEYRELPMVIGSLKRSLRTQTVETIARKIPEQYTLNKGHVTFFFDKQGYLVRRFNNLCVELKRRGYNINPGERTLDFEAFPREFRNDWYPDDNAHQINLERILYRIKEKEHWYRFMGEQLNLEEYEQMISKHY